MSFYVLCIVYAVKVGVLLQLAKYYRVKFTQEIFSRLFPACFMMPFGKYSLEIQACWEKAVILWLYICRLWVLCIVKRLRKQDIDSIMKYVDFHRQPSSQAMPIWKWSVELVLGFLLFVVLYGC